MDIDEILKELKAKIKDSKSLSGFNSKHFGFKNWQATTIQILRELPSLYFKEVNDFRKLTFENTGYQRGNKFSSRTDNTKYIEDLDTAVIILKKIISKKKLKDDKKDIDSSTDQKTKPVKPAAKKPSSKKTSLEKSMKKPASGKKPAKKSSSSKKRK